MFSVVWKSLLASILMTAVSWAQQTADSSVSSAGKPSTAEAQTVVTDPDSQADPQPEKTGPRPEKADSRPEKADPPPEKVEPPPAETDSETRITPPDKYRASERISDDLSVSFPVDI